MLIKRLSLSGLALMGAVAVCSAVWPAVAVVVADVFVSLLVMAAAVPAVLGGWRVRREVARQRELQALSVVHIAGLAPEPVVPTLAELRDSA